MYIGPEEKDPARYRLQTLSTLAVVKHRQQLDMLGPCQLNKPLPARSIFVANVAIAQKP